MLLAWTSGNSYAIGSSGAYVYLISLYCPHAFEAALPLVLSQYMGR